MKRFALRPPQEDKRINILEGSVRSGKTWALHPKIIRCCAYDVPGIKLITGVSKTTIMDNVLNDLFSLIGPRHYSFNSTTGLLRLFGSTWRVLGARDEGSEKYLRGKTVGVAISDEFTLVPKGFWQMLYSRMSPENARFYATTNCDTPVHYVKTELLDNAELREQGLLWSMHCTMEDNPNLSDVYKESLKLVYKGLFYQRYILGLWVMAEGSIYRDCWDDCMVYDELPPAIRNCPADRYVSVDCGVDHPQVYGEWFDDGDTVWLDKEYFWSSRVQMRQKTDAQYADDLAEFMGRNTWCQVIMPPEAASFRLECQNRGMWVTDADNKVTGAEGGIKTVASLMAKRKLRINRNCTNTLAGIPVYAWNEKAALRGKEEPMKQDDDACDMLRYGLHGKIPVWRVLG